LEQQIARERTTAPDIARHRALFLRGKARIVNFDPKQGGDYFNRIYCVDHATFDLDEECTAAPLGPMRYTDRVSKDDGSEYATCAGINVFSVKISTSDVGFPIHVYGTVITRDTIDNKCLYLFRRDRDHCQPINSEDESLMLTGPKRGLVLLDDDHVEIDLKIKDHEGRDKELSKGYIKIKGVPLMKRAVEATIAVEGLEGDFAGEITAHTTSIQERLVIHDSKLCGVTMADDGNRQVIQLMRPIICVYVEDKLIIGVRIGDDNYEGTSIEFTPRVNGNDEEEITVGVTVMRVKVTWSIMDF
ncbi:hypothetical protein EJB05_34468, partial [Eragrostis curvula]